MTAGGVPPGLVGLALSYAMVRARGSGGGVACTTQRTAHGMCLPQSVTGLLNWLVRSSTETETYLASVERVQYYTNLPVERPPIVYENRPRAEWPQAGHILLEGVTVRYRPELAPVLRDVNLSIEAGEKVGVCGRTGAGKSSLMLALYRILEVCATARHGSAPWRAVQVALVARELLHTGGGWCNHNRRH